MATGAPSGLANQPILILKGGSTRRRDKEAQLANISAARNIARDHFSEIAIDSVMQVLEKKVGKMSVDKDDIRIVKKTGRSLLDTQLIRGIIVDKEVVQPDMPKRIEDAKIALLDCALEIEKTEIDAGIRIRNPLQMKAFLDEKSNMLKEMVDRVTKTKANVVLCQRGIDDARASTSSLKQESSLLGGTKLQIWKNSRKLQVEEL